MFDRKKQQIDQIPAPPYDIPKKADRIHLLLQIRHIKNIYYKYTNNPSFKNELYESFLTDTDFDYGLSAYDDNEDVRIFDKYILQYIEKRKEYLQNLEKYHLYVSTGHLEEHPSDSDYHILFIIDMTDKKIFEYCYNMYNISPNDFKIINTIFSAIIYKDMNKTIKLFQ